MPKGRKPKPMVSQNVVCPWCGKESQLVVKREVIEPSVPAQTRLDVILEKQDQTTLQETKQPEDSMPKKKRAKKKEE